MFTIHFTRKTVIIIIINFDFPFDPHLKLKSITTHLIRQSSSSPSPRSQLLGIGHMRATKPPLDTISRIIYVLTSHPNASTNHFFPDLALILLPSAFVSTTESSYPRSTATPTLPLTRSLLSLSSLVRPSILISALFSMSAGQHSEPYDAVGLTTLLWNSRFGLVGVRLPHETPDASLRQIRPRT